MDSSFWLTNAFSRNLNTMNLKVFSTMAGYTNLRENSTNVLVGEIKPSEVHQNMRERILEVNPKGLG